METPAEHLVSIELGKEKIDFLIDTGATYSVLNTNQGNLSQETVNYVGATGKLEKHSLIPLIKIWQAMDNTPIIYGGVSNFSFGKRPVK